MEAAKDLILLYWGFRIAVWKISSFGEYMTIVLPVLSFVPLRRGWGVGWWAWEGFCFPDLHACGDG